jgi:fructose-bisphosphate aldolase class I
MLFETPGANAYLSAAILDPETLYQKSSTDGMLFPAKLTSLGIVPGVKPHLKVHLSIHKVEDGAESNLPCASGC